MTVTCVCIVMQSYEIVRGLQKPFFSCREKLVDHVYQRLPFKQLWRPSITWNKLFRPVPVCGGRAFSKTASHNVLKMEKKLLADLFFVFLPKAKKQPCPLSSELVAIERFKAAAEGK